jgi:hypothetical protein
MYFDTESVIPLIRDNDVDNKRWQVVISITDG